LVSIAPRFESSKKEYWAHSCFIYSCLENSFKGNHAAMEYYLMLHQKNLDAGITELFEASKLLDDICAHFKDTSEVTKTKLTLEFSSFRVKEGETVEVYATRFESPSSSYFFSTGGTYACDF
jgi:nitroreductase